MPRAIQLGVSVPQFNEPQGGQFGSESSNDCLTGRPASALHFAAERTSTNPAFLRILAAAKELPWTTYCVMNSMT